MMGIFIVQGVLDLNLDIYVPQHHVGLIAEMETLLGMKVAMTEIRMILKDVNLIVPAP